MTADDFAAEVRDALKAYEKFVVCLDKTPEEFRASVSSLMEKAIKAYLDRGPNLRHGIALDRHVTIILSQRDRLPAAAEEDAPSLSMEEPRPLCGIYFNLHSPYQKKSTPRKARVEGSR